VSRPLVCAGNVTRKGKGGVALDRCALFVDASYALGDGARAVHGTRNRDSVSWDYAGLLKLLGSMSRDCTGLPLLRCYWYDTSPDGNRADEHDAVADIPGVKLRLVKIRPSRKEGVEAEIRKDLTALARNHAVSDVIIVSAEEDLAPVIAEVQDLGIRAILLTIATEDSWAASRALRQECDDLIEVSPGHLRPYVDLISGAEPQLAAAGYRELADGGQSAEQHPAIEAPAQRLYSSPLPTLYDSMPQPQLAGLSGHREQREPVHGHSQEPSVQQPARAQQYQHSEGGRELMAAHGDQGFRASGYPAQESAGSQAGQPSDSFGQHGVSDDRNGRSGPLPGSLPIGVPGAAQLGAPGQNGVAGTGMASGRDNVPAGQPDNGLPAGMPLAASGPGAGASQNGLPGNGLRPVAHGGQLPGGYTGNGLPAPGGQGGGQPAVQQHSLRANGLAGNGIQGPQYGEGSGPQPGSGQDASGLQAGLGSGSAPHAGMQQPGGMSAGSVNHAGPGQSQHGSQGPGGQGQAGLPQNGMPNQAIGQFGGPQPQSQPMQAQSLPGQSMPAQSMQAPPARPAAPGPVHAPAQSGLPPASPGSVQSPGAHSQQLPGQQLPGQQLPGQALPGSGHAGPQRHGSNPGVPLSAGQSNGLAPLESQRPLLPERQLPAGNGVHYAPDGSAPYGGGPVQPAQFAGPPSSAYGRGVYGGQPGAPSPGLSVGDAVQSAHAEGFGFGEAVARDAPALWLEAVLARKPRMPSDLEARLLQGSALPIDSLLHDEVRHALRRGFWDALERSRH
jgi:NYN domain